MHLRRLILYSLFACTLFTSASGCSGEKKMPGEGDAAPDFTLKNQVQMNVTLSNFKGKKNVILVFYPMDFTPV